MELEETLREKQGYLGFNVKPENTEKAKKLKYVAIQYVLGIHLGSNEEDTKKLF